jgi:hypothetical protein
MQLMGDALAEVVSEIALPMDAEQFLRSFLEGMSTFLINHA